MSKKVLSILLTAAILITSTLFSGLVVAAETTTWAVGDKPYAVNGKDGGIEVYEASKATFYDDFMVPSYWNFESASDIATLQSSKSIQLNNANKTAITNNAGTEYVWMDLSTETEGVNENAYGGSGNSLKLTTTNTVGVKHMDGTYYNAVRRNTVSFDCTAFPSFDDIAVSFWVKTETGAQFSTAFWDTNTNTGKKIYSDFVKVSEAGEYIIVIPLSNFQISSTAYVKNEDVSTFKIYNFELMFKALGLENDETADIYIDNIGIYAIKPNFRSVDTSEIANVVDNFNDYAQTATKTVTSASNAALNWTTSDGACSSVNVITNNGDTSIVYNATSYLVRSSTSYNTIQATNNDYMFYATDKTGTTNYGVNGTLAFYVKASRATTLTVRINTQDMLGWLESAEHKIPAGESIVRIPLSEFGDSTLTRVRKSVIRFGSTAPNTNTIGGTAGTFELDDIAFEPTFVAGDVNGDKAVDICDIVKANGALVAVPADITAYDVYTDSVLDSHDIRMFRYSYLGHISALPLTAAKITEESFSASNPLFKNWVGGNEASFSQDESALFYHSRDNDTSAIVMDYVNITADKGSKIYYNAGLQNPYGTDGVFGFWVYSEQSLNLRCNYLDDSETTGKLQGCKWVTKTIPAGESFVTFDMAELDPSTEANDYQMQYNRVYQFQINVWSNSDTENTSGTLYLDSFGFYDKDTTNGIPATE